MCFISTVVVVPITIYSIYSQWKVGKICPLCLMILFCMIIQAIMFIYICSGTLNIGLLLVWIACAFCFLCLFILYSNNRLNELDRLDTKIESLKLKRNKDILLLTSSRVEDINASIWLGAEASQIIVTTIISPSCKRCRKTVSELLSLSERKIEFRWNIILGKTSNSDSEMIKIWIQNYVYDKKKFIQDLYLWSNGRIRNFSNDSNSNQHELKIKEIYMNNERQLDSLRILGYPRIILNDRLLSQLYSSEDLELLITDQSNMT